MITRYYSLNEKLTILLWVSMLFFIPMSFFSEAARLLSLLYIFPFATIAFISFLQDLWKMFKCKNMMGVRSSTWLLCGSFSISLDLIMIMEGGKLNFIDIFFYAFICLVLLGYSTTERTFTKDEKERILNKILETDTVNNAADPETKAKQIWHDIEIQAINQKKDKVDILHEVF